MENDSECLNLMCADSIGYKEGKIMDSDMLYSHHPIETYENILFLWLFNVVVME